MINEETREQAREIFKTASRLKQHIGCGFSKSMKCDHLKSACCDMTLPQTNALLTIKEQGGVTVKELSELLLVSPPSASAMVDRLVEIGVVDRMQNQQDRREVRIQLSNKGKQTMKDVEDIVLATLIDLLDKVGPDTARQWVEVYKRVHEVLDSDECQCQIAQEASGKEEQE